MQHSTTNTTDLSQGKLAIPPITCTIKEADDILSRCIQAAERLAQGPPAELTVYLQDKALHLSLQQSGITRTKNLQGLSTDSTWTMPILVNNNKKTTTQIREVTESQPATAPITRTQPLEKRSAVELKGIDEIRQLNKKKINAKRKK
jgi:hypothetical protein